MSDVMWVRKCEDCGEPATAGLNGRNVCTDCAMGRRRQPPIPFVHGSPTSEAAAQAVRAKAPSQRARVLAFVSGRGGLGATDDEIEVGLALPHQSASARRNGLVRDGKLRDGGERRKTRAGQWAVVWVLGEGTALEGAPNRRGPKRPEAAEIREALAEMAEELWYGSARFQSEAALKLRAWLEYLARS